MNRRVKLVILPSAKFTDGRRLPTITAGIGSRKRQPPSLQARAPSISHIYCSKIHNPVSVTDIASVSEGLENIEDCDDGVTGSDPSVASQGRSERSTMI